VTNGVRCALLMVLAGSALAQTPAISLHIETTSGRTQFKMGEAISLKLTFENSSAETWRVPGVDGSGRSVLGLMSDRFLVSPKEGTADPWSFRLSEAITYNGPPGGMSIGAKPVAMNVDLNEWVRFGHPGRYLVSALLHANSGRPPDVAVSSNEIEIEIVPADREWLAEQLRQEVAVLEAPAGIDYDAFQARHSAVRALSYLDTPESVREAARLLGTVDQQTAQQLDIVLRGSEDQVAAISAMNQLLRSPDQAVTPAFIQTLARMESRERVPLPADRDARDPDGARRNDAVAATEPGLRSELASVVAQKRGDAKAISLNTVVTGMRYELVTENLRDQLVAVFVDLPRNQQNDLLGWQWKRIAGPAMIPVLRQIYDNLAKDPGNSPADAAVQRLYELDPAGTRPLILDEMKRAALRLQVATLAILDDATLPEMDRVLLDNLQRSPWQQDTGAELIARYATADILDSVKEFYEKRDAMRRARTSPDISSVGPSSCQPALIGYFLRVDPAWGERVLRGVLNDREVYPRGGCWMGIVGRTAKYNAGAAWEKVAIEALGNPVAEVKMDAVKALGAHGSAAAQPAVMDAFRAWHDLWKDRPAEMASEGPFEQTFLQASVRAHNWVATGGDLEKVRDICITSGCRSEAETYIRQWGEAVPVSINESFGGDVSVSFAQYLPTPINSARVRLLQLPAGTRINWQLNLKRTPEIDAWVAAIENDLAGRGVVITP
jgi:hypothetical protein